MLLAIDIGNTNIVIGCFKGEKVIFTERMKTTILKLLCVAGILFLTGCNSADEDFYENPKYIYEFANASGCDITICMTDKCGNLPNVFTIKNEKSYKWVNNPNIIIVGFRLMREAAPYLSNMEKKQPLMQRCCQSTDSWWRRVIGRRRKIQIAEKTSISRHIHLRQRITIGR